MNLTLQGLQTSKVFIISLLLFALLCAAGYQVLVERQATVQLEAETTAITTFKVYCLPENLVADRPWHEDYARHITLQPGTSFYTFTLPNLAKIADFRIDPSEEPAQVTIRSIILTQNGYAPIRIVGKEMLSRLTVGKGIQSARLTEQGLVVIPADRDPQLFFDLPGTLQRTPWSWCRTLVPFALIFTSVVVVGLIGQHFIQSENKFGQVPICLAMILVLIATMATISRLYAHPDEGPHEQAGQYYQSHVLPPPVGAPEIQNTYSSYGISRLHSGEIAYLFLGKFAQIFQDLSLPSYMVQRYFNVTLWGILALLAFAYADFRLVMLPALLSPQVWYMFSYVNSEAFACAVMMLAAWQLASPESMWNRLLAMDLWSCRQCWFSFVCLGLLFALLLLIKKNFYFFLLFAGAYFAWRVRFGYTRLHRKNLQNITAVLLIGITCFTVVRSVDAYINDFHKSERVLKARYQFAEEMWNPGTPLDKQCASLQMSKRGTSMHRLFYIDRWGAKSFRTAVGVYGQLTVSASLPYYRAMQYMGILFLLTVSITILLNGGWGGITLWGLTISCSLGLMAFAFYHAWTVDFQPQGRYFLPIIGMLSILFVQEQRYIMRSFVPFCCVGLLLLSLYSFLCVGLPGIMMVGQFAG